MTEKHDQPIDTQGDTAMRGRAVLQCVQKEAETLAGLLRVNPQQFENLLLLLLIVDTNGSPAGLGAVDYQIVAPRPAFSRISGFEWIGRRFYGLNRIFRILRDRIRPAIQGGSCRQTDRDKHLHVQVHELTVRRNDCGIPTFNVEADFRDNCTFRLSARCLYLPSIAEYKLGPRGQISQRGSFICMLFVP